jgi:hypothetical protein
MTTSDIDRAVLSVVRPGWRKVAMVLAQAADRLGSELPEGDAGFEMIGRRVEVLVRSGGLVAQGDVSDYRHSEVRLL